MSNKFAHIKWKHYVNYIGVGAVIILLTVLAFTGVVGSSANRNTTILLENIAIAVILATSLNFVVGFLGELSLGHAGFMCVGAYLGGKTASILATTFFKDMPFLAFIIALIVGGACAGVCGFIIGLPALRLKGDYLAITTLAFGEIVKILFFYSSEKTFGGENGLKTVPRFNKAFFVVACYVLVLITLFVLQSIIRSKHGRAITAIRDNEIAAKATGINVTRYKLMGFVVSSVFAGIAGVLFSSTQSQLTSKVFDYNYSIGILVMVVLGGLGSINGSIIAAALVTFLNAKLSSKLPANLAVLKDLIYALVLILIVIYNNAPALANFRQKHNLRNLFKRLTRSKDKVSKKDADDAARWDVVPTKIKMDVILSTDLSIDDKPEEQAEEDKK